MPRRDFTGISKYNIPDWLIKNKKTGQGISGNVGARTFPKNPFADISGFNPYILTEVDENGKLRRGIWKKPEELIAHGYVYDPETKGWALPTETPIRHERGMAPATSQEIVNQTELAEIPMFNVAPDVFGKDLQVGATITLEGINPDGTYRWRVVSQPAGGGKAINTF